jgi:hypothetical protein
VKLATQVVNDKNVGVEKVVFCTNGLKSGERKCLPGPRKSLVGHPCAMHSPRVLRGRVFNTRKRFVCSGEASFVKYGIPALAFKFCRLPGTPEQKTFNDRIHIRYHHPNDDLNQPIDREAALHFDRVLLALVKRVPNAPTKPAWYPESFFTTIPRR